MRPASSWRSGVLSNKDRGAGSSQPPDIAESVQWAPARSIAGVSARSTLPTEKPAQTSSSAATPWLQRCASAASTAAETAPADVPTRT